MATDRTHYWLKLMGKGNLAHRLDVPKELREQCIADVRRGHTHENLSEEDIVARGEARAICLHNHGKKPEAEKTVATATETKWLLRAAILVLLLLLALGLIPKARAQTGAPVDVTAVGGTKVSGSSLPVNCTSGCGGGSGSNPAAGATGSAVPADADFLGVQDASGNLQGVTQNSSTYTNKHAIDINILGVLGTAFSTPGLIDIKGADGNVFVRSNAANTFPVNANQSGTWTVQPGNTANTTPWLATINQGGNSAAVTAGNALKVDGSAVIQPVNGIVTANAGTGTFQTQPVGNSSFFSGQQVVSTTPTALPINSARNVCVTAKSSNGESVFIGGSTVSPATGDELAPGSKECWPLSNSNLVYVVGLSTGETVTWSASN